MSYDHYIEKSGYSDIKMKEQNEKGEFDIIDEDKG